VSGTPTLSWGIKESLLAYIERLDDGAIDITAGASREGNEFHFTFDESSSDFNEEAGEGVLQFRGSVVLTGHWGAMRVEIHDPRLTIAGGGAGDIEIRTNSVLSGERFETFATLTVTSSGPALEATTSLAAPGQLILGQQYSVGQELSQLRVSWT
jgi:hypothetical protein